jgi:hypothetical protein
MKVSRTATAILLVVMLVAVAAISAAPRLVMPETTFNFGYVPQNAKISHEFWLYSKGEDSLHILKVVPG